MAMNEYQEIWWQQAKSDHSVFVLLRGQGVPPCHSLHYLQMVTEKIAKGLDTAWLFSGRAWAGLG